MCNVDRPWPAACTLPCALSRRCACTASTPLPASVPPVLSSVPSTCRVRACVPLAVRWPPAVLSVPVLMPMVCAEVVAWPRSVLCPVMPSVPLLMMLPPRPWSVSAAICNCPVPACWIAPWVLSSVVACRVRSPLLATVPPALFNVCACSTLASLPLATIRPPPLLSSVPACTWTLAAPKVPWRCSTVSAVRVSAALLTMLPCVLSTPLALSVRPCAPAWLSVPWALSS